ncbi:hypothetical protein AMTRI_Chr11g155260 [Amborella trichopoda]
MDCSYALESSGSLLHLLIQAALLVSPWQYFLGISVVFLIFLSNFMEFHVFSDMMRGFKGDRVKLTFNLASEMANGLLWKCHHLHGRLVPGLYTATPWLASPHLQTAFLHFFGRPPIFEYKRQMFSLGDGGTVALDWLMSDDVSRNGFNLNQAISKDDIAPIVVVIPGLTSDSSSASDCFYNAGWTEDLRKVISHVHHEFPKAPLFAVGTSIGANILVKYLGEEGEDTPIVGAASICSPWDLVVCDRFINRRLVQKFYDRILTIGLVGYAQLHQRILSRLADWECIAKSRSVRDFDNHVTCLVGKFETVDTYYRRCSSVNYIGNVSVPLLCISALDDPVCTMEAIPWDECRANKNIVLATTTHGGHLAYFEGLTAKSVWWVGAVEEFLCALHSSPFKHKQKKNVVPCSALESLVDKGPYVNILEDGMVAAVANSSTNNDFMEAASENNQLVQDPIAEKNNGDSNNKVGGETRSSAELVQEVSESSSEKPEHHANTVDRNDVMGPIKRSINQLSRNNRKSMWVLVYIAIVTTWPLVGSALIILARKKLRNVIPASWFER